jgi:hypothetical protein
MSRNVIPFGYTAFGGVILVKLNVKISQSQALKLNTKYPTVINWDNGKFGRALEGFIQLGQVSSFIRDLNDLKLDAKIERLMEQKAALLDLFIADNSSANLDLI